MSNLALRLIRAMRRDPGQIVVPPLSEPDYQNSIGEIVARVTEHAATRTGPHTGRDSISFDEAHGALLDRLIDADIAAMIADAHRERDRIVQDITNTKITVVALINRLAPALTQARTTAHRATEVHAKMWAHLAPHGVTDIGDTVQPLSLPHPGAGTDHTVQHNAHGNNTAIRAAAAASLPEPATPNSGGTPHEPPPYSGSRSDLHLLPPEATGTSDE